MTTPLPIGLRRLMKLADVLESVDPEFLVTRSNAQILAKGYAEFDMHYSEALELFCSVKREMKWELAKRIRRFVEGKVAK